MSRFGKFPLVLNVVLITPRLLVLLYFRLDSPLLLTPKFIIQKHLEGSVGGYKYFSSYMRNNAQFFKSIFVNINKIYNICKWVSIYVFVRVASLYLRACMFVCPSHVLIYISYTYLLIHINLIYYIMKTKEIRVYTSPIKTCR